ncbi:helix-turn-helix domain-containing protein [Agrobacterium tumefaciens]|nr:helix-turn-helix domain-containing protein [Agrobacterium tumefaciens]
MPGSILEPHLECIHPHRFGRRSHEIGDVARKVRADHLMIARWIGNEPLIIKYLRIDAHGKAAADLRQTFALIGLKGSDVYYLTDWRLALGRSQLRSGRSVKTVAAAVGFGSAEAFSRSFTHKYGYTPSQERIAP